ncbi:MAG: bacterioferritin-associated ferredoxin [Rhodospirillaceae bacterium]|nr:bacterioferritin-associated ferredoxin [Rhodospirillaceae bacterium]
MYVCNCNGISERMVQTALNDGAKTWIQVHEYFEFAPCCGKCNTEITDAITLKTRQEPAARPSSQSVFKSPLLAREF